MRQVLPVRMALPGCLGNEYGFVGFLVFLLYVLHLS